MQSSGNDDDTNEWKQKLLSHNKNETVSLTVTN